MLENRVIELVIVLLLVMALFGAKRLPDTARSLGRALRILKAEGEAMAGDGKAGDGKAAQVIAQHEAAEYEAARHDMDAARQSSGEGRGEGRRGR